MKILPIFAFFLFAGLAAPAFGQKIPDKPYSEWSRDAALKIVSESGWAKIYTSMESRAGADRGNLANQGRDTVNRGGGQPGSVARSTGNTPIVIRLHSAPLVRQATVRLQQLSAGYDKMSSDQKAAFDAGRKGFLDCAICKDYYVVTIAKYANTTDTVTDGIFSAVTLDDIKGQVTLVNDNGEKRELVQFTPSKGSNDPAVMFFKRLDENGKPLLTPESKELQVQFSSTFIDWNKRDAGLYPRRFEFPVSKMMIGGEVIF